MALSTHRVAGTANGVRTAFRNGLKPFTSSRRAPASIVRKAAEEEAAETAEAPAVVDTDTFVFNYNEAKKGNSYEASDVKAAMDYYSSGAGDMPYEADFAVNRFGTEDASFFDDIDNNEGYAASEYLSVGIEEAAPKTKQRARDDDEAFDEAVEEFDQERAAAAAFEGVEVLDEDLLDDADVDDAPWAWDEAPGAAPKAPVASVAANAEEDALLAQLAAIDFDALKDEDLEQRELASMIVDALGDDLDLVALADPEGEMAPAQGLTQAEEADVADVLAVEVGEVPELDAAVAAAAAELEADAPPADDGAPLPAGEVEAYLAALRAVDAAAAGGSAASLGDDVEKELAGDADEASLAPFDVSVPDLPASLLAADPSLESGLGDGEDAESDAVLAAFKAELAELEAIQVADYNNPLGSAALFPEEAELETYESVIDATREYMAATGDEVTSELFDDEAVDDDAAINPYDDLDESMVARGPLVELEDDDSNFQERILELSRVTKVVKGGKIMGFRAVVVVGDGNGRVGVGCQSGREVGTAVKRSLVDAKKNLVQVPLVGAGTLPHRTEAWFKAAGVVVVPASEGTGVIAGGAVRSVLELAGVQNVLAKRLGSRSVLNNARVTIKALEQLRTLGEVARMRDLPLQALLQ